MRALAVVIALCGAAGATGIVAAQPGSAVVVQPPLEAGVPEVSAAASPSVVRLGAPFTVFVTIAFDPGVEVNLREPVDVGAAFEVRRRDSADSRARTASACASTSSSSSRGSSAISKLPPIAVTFTLAGHAGQVATNAVPIRVGSVLGAVSTIRSRARTHRRPS